MDKTPIHALPFNLITVTPKGVNIKQPTYSGLVAGHAVYGTSGLNGLKWWQVIRQIDTRYPVRVKVEL